MLFNSDVFLLGFLPITLVLCHFLATRNEIAAQCSLVLLSLVFYAWWHPPYLFLLLASLTANYGLAGALSKGTLAQNKMKLTCGIAFNLFLLGYFKYRNFFLEPLSTFAASSTQSPWISSDIPIPLGISFFTFQQVAFLVDLTRREVERPPLIRYVLFVTFFP